MRHPAPPATPSSISLPPPPQRGPLSLEQAFRRRRSLREFSDQPLSLEPISALLWAAQGLTDSRGHRAAPSAGALYPLEIYAVQADGVFHYDPRSHGLKRLRADDARRALCAAALDQEMILQAPLTVVIAAVYARIEVKYGRERGPRYVHMEVGHAAQNVLLQAAALGLGAVVVGAFDDDRVAAVLGLPADHAPLYLIPIGHSP